MSAVTAESAATTVPSACAEHVVTDLELTTYRQVVRSPIVDRAATGPLTGPSPVYPYVLTSRTFADALRSLAAVGSDGPTLPTPVLLSEEIRIHRPLRVGEWIMVTSDVVGVRPDPRGARVALRSRLTVPDGAAIAELLTTAMVVGNLSLDRLGHVPLQRGRGSATWTSSFICSIPRDMPRRYADVSGNDSGIHLRSRDAKAVGFPDVVAQGMSIVALACETIIDRHAGGDARRIRAVGARFSGPVVPGEQLEIRLSDLDGGTVHFCCVTERGTAVRKAWVEVGDLHVVRGADRP